MKISFFGNFNELSTEGRFTFVSALKNFLVQKGFKVVVNNVNADVIHAHSSGIFLSRRINKIKTVYKKPCIYSLYSTCETKLLDYLRYYTEQWKYFQDELSLKHFILASSSIIPLKYKRKWLKNLDMVTVPSQHIKDKLFENTKVIHLGVDIKKFRNRSIEKNAKKVVSFIGANNSSKGLIDYLNSTKILDRWGYDFVFKIFLVDAPNKLRRYISSINKNISLYQNEQEMPKVYNESDIIVLPYRMSIAAVANPLVLLEAMACEKKIVTTNLPNILEIVKDSAITVKPYSPIGIANGIIKIKNDNNKGEEARTIIKQRYNQKKIFQEYIKIYEELA